MKNTISKTSVISIIMISLLFVGQSWSQLANLAITETYFDGTDERIYISNQSETDFLETVTISGASSQSISKKLSIGAGKGILLCDQCGMLSGDYTIVSGLGLSLSDSSPRNISLWFSGIKLDQFSPGGLIGQLNDKKQSIIKTQTGYYGSQGSSCIQGYFCDISNLYQKEVLALIVSEVYGGDNCIGEYILVEAVSDFSGYFSLENKTRYIDSVISGDKLLFSNNAGRTGSYIYGYSGNIVQSKGGIINTKINNHTITYSLGELSSGMVKKASSGQSYQYLFEDSLIDVDESCNTISINESTACGDISISGNYNGIEWKYEGYIENSLCDQMQRKRNTQKGGVGCHFGFTQQTNVLGRVFFEGVQDGKQCKQDLVISAHGIGITGEWSLPDSSIVSQSQEDKYECEIIIQETNPFYARQGFNVALAIQGKTISGTGCALSRKGSILTDRCNPSSITIYTGGVDWLYGSTYVNGKTYTCKMLLNLPQASTESKGNISETINQTESNASYLDDLIRGLSKWGLWFDRDNNKIDIKRVYDSGIDVGIPQILSTVSGDLYIEYINPKTDSSTDSEVVVIQHIREYGQTISGYYLVYKNKRYDVGGFWSSLGKKTLAKRWGFNNTSGCVYLTSKEYVYQTYCRGAESVTKTNKDVGVNKKQTKNQQNEQDLSYDYTKQQCEIEKGLIEYGYRDYIKQIQNENKIKKSKKKATGSIKKKIKVVRIKKYSKIEQELKLYKNFVSIIISLIKKRGTDLYQNDEFDYIYTLFKNYRQQINKSRSGAQIYTGNILQQSFKGYVNPSEISQLKELLQ